MERAGFKALRSVTGSEGIAPDAPRRLGVDHQRPTPDLWPTRIGLVPGRLPHGRLEDRACEARQDRR